MIGERKRKETPSAEFFGGLLFPMVVFCKAFRYVVGLGTQRHMIGHESRHVSNTVCGALPLQAEAVTDTGFLRQPSKVLRSEHILLL
jgi:hypothetical protein